MSGCRYSNSLGPRSACYVERGPNELEYLQSYDTIVSVIIVT